MDAGKGNSLFLRLNTGELWLTIFANYDSFARKYVPHIRTPNADFESVSHLFQQTKDEESISPEYQGLQCTIFLDGRKIS